jgi:hypothetical protein
VDAELLAIVLFIVAVAVPMLLYRLWWVWRKRRQLWEAVAVELGLSLTIDDRQLHGRHADLSFFRVGRDRRARVALRGERSGGDVCLADYQYTTGSGKSTRTTAQTVCLVGTPGVKCPHVLLRRERPILDALAQAFGGQDIDFDDDERFSKAFVLRGEDDAAVRELLDFETRQELLPLAERGVQLEACGDTLLVRTGRLIDPAAARELLQQALDLARILQRRRGTW